jgi:hypothetical protein
LSSKEKRDFLCCKKKFLHFFPKGFQDQKYHDWERTYKWETHLEWKHSLHQSIFEELLRKKKYEEICQRALKIESKTHLLFSFEKMAIRDALKTPQARRSFAIGLYHFLYGKGDTISKFEVVE